LDSAVGTGSLSNKKRQDKNWSHAIGAEVLAATVNRFAGRPASGTVAAMTVQPGNLTMRSSTTAATAVAALSMLVVASGASWPQAAPPQPSLGLQEQSP
jgi:hypothetical protein